MLEILGILVFLITTNTSLGSPTGQKRLLSDVKLKSSGGGGGVGLFKQGVLPSGFPDSVPADYARFQCWNLVQDGCSYIRGVMSMGRVFEGLGVGGGDAGGGDPAATAAAAAVTIATRDGLSMIGSLLFSSYFKSFFSQNTKSWRYAADMLNNVALAIEVVAPAFPSAFVALLCLSALLRACVGVAAGSTGVVIANHWGEKTSNTAEVNAVNGNQHTLVSLSLLAVTFLINRATRAGIISIHSRFLAGSFVALTLVHIIANLRAMRVLALRSLNVSRVKLLARSFVASRYDEMTPASVARREPLLGLILPRRVQRAFERTQYYADLAELEERGVFPAEVLKAKLDQYRDMPYCCIAHRGRAYCSFTGSEEPLDRAKGILLAELELRAAKHANVHAHHGVVEDTKARGDELFPQFWAQLEEKGWKTGGEQLLLPQGELGYRRATD